jgi:hypothetical protein
MCMIDKAMVFNVFFDLSNVCQFFYIILLGIYIFSWELPNLSVSSGVSYFTPYIVGLKIY